MKLDLTPILTKNDIIGVACSGGSDSMALLYFMHKNQKKYGITVKAVNIEHGIRGENSINDTNFVKNYCKKHKIELISYSVDAINYSKQHKLSLEEGARKLRYDCFDDAISKGLITKIATAHHAKDNAETVLINLFRGTGLKGITGIEENYQNKIIRPFLSLSKEDIENFIDKNKIPFVVDETNLSTDYTRNYIRLNLLEKVKEIFPEYEKAVLRLSKIAKMEEEFLQNLAIKELKQEKDGYSFSVNLEKALFYRVATLALKNLVKKDYEIKHINAIYSLISKNNGTKITLLRGVFAIKEYDKIVVFSSNNKEKVDIPFAEGEFPFEYGKLTVTKMEKPINLKDGFYIDENLLVGAKIRFVALGDLFYKFGGGSKKLTDIFTDKKIPVRKRKALPIIENNGKILFVAKVGISELAKTTDQTKMVYKLTYEEF
ncbi:MAG: tRNA lysidine(34) synthetase TilS [Clostridiales bacterium]|nr:tRNA lysidine(34) synthetase TilS [Clostridiales bacterium]